MAAGDREGVARAKCCQREGRGLEGGVTPAAAHEPGEQRSRAGDERSAPGAEHDHRGDVHPGRDAEDSRADGLADAGALGLLDQLGGERSGAQQGERRQRPVHGRKRSAHGHNAAAGDGQVREQGKPHKGSIGCRSGRA